MSQSYRAIDTRSGRKVVLKVPFADLFQSPTATDRFEREIAIGQQLRHPAIQRTLATGRIDGTAAPFLVLEYVEGESFRTFLDQSGPLPSDQAIDFVLQIARAIAYCHECGVVHRDLKPENLIITAEGRLWLLDFGTALLQAARRVTWGRLMSAIGTPVYMAPEQVQGERGDARTDVYALGMILFEMLAGRLPYYRADALTVMKEHLLSEAPRLRALRDDVAPALDFVVAKAIRRDPMERYESAAAMVQDLEHLDQVDLATARWNKGHNSRHRNVTLRELFGRLKTRS